jgi:Protein of unknown function (DUF3142)
MTRPAPVYSRRRAVIAVGVFALAAVSAAPYAPAAPVPLPPLMLWAWERPTDLRSLSSGTGVAFLSQTIHVRGAAIGISPRRQKLLVSSSTPLLAVTRIEATPAELSDLDDDLLRRFAMAIAATASLPRVRGVQIDFDATLSQRPLYRRLLHEVRRQLGPETFLSMTALASWCMRDDWLEGLPVNEVVPMLFRMGPGERVPERLRGGGCGPALGTALDEPLSRSLSASRVYVFNADPWSPRTITEASRRATP